MRKVVLERHVGNVLVRVTRQAGNGSCDVEMEKQYQTRPRNGKKREWKKRIVKLGSVCSGGLEGFAHELLLVARFA